MPVKVAVNHAETFNDIVSMDVIFWMITFKEHPSVKKTLKVLNIVDTASGMHIAIQIADQTAETIWKAFAAGWLRWAGSQGVSSTRQKDEAYLWNQHRLKHIGRWDRWKTMPGICDKWDAELLRTWMCRRATSRQCLTS